MPGSIKKDLYIAKSVSELNKLASDIPKVTGARLFANSAEKVYREAEDSFMLGDEERSYVLYMKYFNLVSAIKKSSDYKKEAKFVDNLIGKKNCMNAITKAEELSASLKKRYEEAEAIEISNKLGKLNTVEVSSEEVKSADDVKDEKIPDGNNGVASNTTSVKQETPGSTGVTTNKGGIDVQTVYRLMKDQGVSLILMDARPADDYEKSHINTDNTISVPEAAVSPGFTASKIEKNLPMASLQTWKKRGHVDYVVLFDWRCYSVKLAPRSTLTSLKDALYKWDQDTILKAEPLILEGGYEEWLMCYPSLTSNPNVKCPLPPINGTSSDLPSLASIDYDVELEFLHSPSPSPPESPVIPPKDTNNALSPSQHITMPHIDRSTKPKPPSTNLNNSIDITKVKTKIDVGSSGMIHNISNSVTPRQPKPDEKVNRFPSASNIPEKNTNITRQPTASANTGHITKMPTVDRSKKPATGVQSPDIGQFSSSDEEDGGPVYAKPMKRGAGGGGSSFPKETGDAGNEVEAEQKRLMELRIMKDREVKNLAEIMRKKKKMEEELKKEEREAQKKLEEEKDSNNVTRGAHIGTRDIGYSSLDNESVSSLEIEASGSDGIDAVSPTATDAGLGSGENERTSQENDRRKADEVRTQEQDQQRDKEIRKAEEERLKAEELRAKEEERLKAEKQRQVEQEAQKKHQMEQEAQKKQMLEQEAQKKHQLEQEAQKKHQLEQEAQKKHQLEQEAQKKRQLEQEVQKKHQLEQEALKKRQLEQEAAALAAKKEHTAGEKTLRDSTSTAHGQSGSDTTLPAGWEKKFDERSKKYYYVDHNTKATRWDPPGALHQKQAEGQASAYKERLKDEEAGSSGSGGLKRSHSSPNIAKMIQDEEEAGRRAMRPMMPQVDRSIKPKPGSNVLALRTEVSAAKVRNLNPTCSSNMGCGLTGLRNLGNTCYMNSTLQCLSNAAPLTVYFLTDSYIPDVVRDDSRRYRGEVASEYAVLVKAIWSGQYKAVSPKDFRGVVCKMQPMFASTQHQDSHELLEILMNGLNEDLNKVRNKPQLPEQDNDNIADEIAAEQVWKRSLLIEDSIIVDLFRGQYKSTLKCIRCDKKSVMFEPFMCLNLPIPSPTRCSLSDCLLHFSKEEKMIGDSQWYCPRCKSKQDAIKRIVIWRLPPVLIVHLERFYYQGIWRDKITTYVDFPVDELDMNRYVSGPAKRQPYHLFAVSNHFGTLDGGHYTAYCKSPAVGKWYKFDDQDVSEMSKSDIKSSAAYMLFYSSMKMDQLKL